MKSNKFPPGVGERLGSYVYVYFDPRNKTPFYVGKGKGNRAFRHLEDQSESRKAERIRRIRKAGLEPRIEVLRYGLTDDQASLLEAGVIDLCGIPPLTNEIHGHHDGSFGRVTTGDLCLQFKAKPVRITHRALLITINQLYRSEMTATELLEATRGVWKLGRRRENAELAMAVYQGIVREVYRVKKWLPAGTLVYSTRDSSEFRDSSRVEFDGEAAESSVRSKYIGRSVGKSSQNPVRYVNC